MVYCLINFTGQSTLMKSIESGYHSAYTIPNVEKVLWRDVVCMSPVLHIKQLGKPHFAVGCVLNNACKL